MPTREELYAALRNADKSGDSEGARKLAEYIQSLPAAGAPAQQAAGSNTGSNTASTAAGGNMLVDDVKGLAAGAGTGFGKMALGAQRMYGKVLSAMDDVLPGKPAPTLSDLATGTKPTSSLSRIANWLVDDADAGKAKLDREVAPFKAASPLATATGEVGGSIVATLPVGGVLPNALRAATGAKTVVGILPRAAQAAGVGAAYGGVTGTVNSNADTAGGMLADGARSAATGAVLGGVSNPVVAAAGAIGSNVMQRVSKSSAAEYAKQKVAEALARDARGTLATGGYTNPLDQAAARLGKLGDEAVLADAGGRNTNQLLDTLATLPGRTKDAAYNLLRQRTAGVGDRLRTAAEDALDTQGQRLPSTVDSLIARRQRDAAPLYNQLRQVSIQPSPKLTEIVKAADELGATNLGREIATARQRPFSLTVPKASDTAPGAAAPPASWNMEDLDHVKQGIDQVLSSRKALNADGTLTPLGHAYQSLKSRLVDELDAATTNSQTGQSLYRNARQAFSEPSALIDAANAGKLAINRDEASIVSTMKGMSDNELQAFRIGAFEGLRGKLGTQGGQTQIMNMWKEPATQEKLKAVFGDLRSYREFASNVAKEAQLRRLQSVGVGSQTAARQAGMGDLDLSALTEAGGAIGAAKSGNLLSALGSAKNVWNRVATPQSVRDQMGSILMSRGAAGERNLNSLEALVQGINARNMLLSNNVGVFGGQIGSKLLAPTPQMK